MRIQDRETDVTMGLLLGAFGLLVIGVVGHAITYAGKHNSTLVPNAHYVAAQTR